MKAIEDMWNFGTPIKALPGTISCISIICQSVYKVIIHESSRTVTPGPLTTLIPGIHVSSTLEQQGHNLYTLHNSEIKSELHSTIKRHYQISTYKPIDNIIQDKARMQPPHCGPWQLRNEKANSTHQKCNSSPNTDLNLAACELLPNPHLSRQKPGVPRRQSIRIELPI